MSNRYPQNRPRNPPNAQMKFVPKTPNSNPMGPSFSTSLRDSSSSDLAGHTAAAGVAPSSSRVRLGDGGHWVSSSARSGTFVNYLPQDEAVAAGLGAEEGGLDPVESQHVVDLLNRELSRLLKLKPREFWKEVAGDSSLHEFLDSFLKFRSRWYDFQHHGAKRVVAGVIVGERELCHRVFMLLYRISSNRDPGAHSADSLSPKDHRVILQDKKLLDLPKLLDVCAVYGHENEDLTRLLISNALKAQPWIHYNLTDVNARFLSIIQTMQNRCSSSVELLLSRNQESHEFKCLHSDFLEVMDFINDAISSMDAFVSAYKAAATFFSSPVETSDGNEDLLCTLVKLHDSLLPSLQKGFQFIYSSSDAFAGDEVKSTSLINLKMLSMRLEKFGWTLLDACYLSDEVSEENLDLPASTKIFPAKVDDPVIRTDIIVQNFRELSNLSHQVVENEHPKTFLPQIDRRYGVMSRLRSLKSNGWIVIDDEQYQYLSGTMMSSGLPAENEPLPHKSTSTVASKEAQVDEEVAVVESRISQIKDLFPDYGEGFLSACLEVYNQNPEEVIQRILEGTLHEDLQSLDTSLKTVPAPKTVASIGAKDKGKGKLYESDALPPPRDPVPASVTTKQGEVSSSFGGRFVRKSKSESPDFITLDTRDSKDLEKISALASQYEYEDEYDDSFDDLGLGGVESAFEESEGLAGGAESGDAAPSSSSKWGSRKKPQFYVKDGKNYSYKVGGSVAVANANEALLVNQAQSGLIYGLGRGGNLPVGAAKRLQEAQDKEENQTEVDPANEGRSGWNPRGRGRRGGGGRGRESHERRNDNQSEGTDGEVMENTEGGRGRGRGRRGGGGGGRNYHRKDRAMNKHFSSLGGH